MSFERKPSALNVLLRWILQLHPIPTNKAAMEAAQFLALYERPGITLEALERMWPASPPRPTKTKPRIVINRRKYYVCLPSGGVLELGRCSTMRPMVAAYRAVRVVATDEQMMREVNHVA